MPKLLFRFPIIDSNRKNLWGIVKSGEFEILLLKLAGTPKKLINLPN